MNASSILANLSRRFGELVAQTLISNMGSVYTEVTLQCLEGDFGVDTSDANDTEDTCCQNGLLAGLVRGWSPFMYDYSATVITNHIYVP
jgi:hypothetical protein